MINHTYNKTSNMLLCGLFAAFTAVAACIVVPMPFTPVPVSLATLAVMVTGGVLGSRLGTISMLVYLLIGAFGLPVFSGFTGGIGRLVGPTGGFLVGYIAMTFIIGLMLEKMENRQESRISFVPMILATGVCYAIATVWFMIVTGSGVLVSLMACVFPFLIGDSVKILVAGWLIKKLRKYTKRLRNNMETTHD